MKSRRDFLSIAAGGTLAAAIVPSLLSAQQLTQEEVFHDPDAPVLGNPHGDVTVTEFFDYHCLYCKRCHPRVEAAVKEDGQVRLLMKDWPVFGDVSVLASQAVLGARELGLYEPTHEALMATPGSLTEDQVKTNLTEVGVDLTKLSVTFCQNDKKIADLLTRNFNQALAFNFRGTPSFVIGASLYSGTLTQDQLRAAIKRARAS